MKQMKVSIFGIGYVGAVTAGCLSQQGHRVTCVDVNPGKVNGINRGQSPIYEPGLDDLLRDGCEHGRLDATLDYAAAIKATEVSIVCVGTPSLESGRLNLQHAKQVVEQIVNAVARKDGFHLLIIRSTMLPGSVRDLARCAKTLIDAGRLEICFCPEFLRESTAILDFHSPGIAVYGSLSGERNATLEDLMGEMTFMPLEAAELIKYSCNYWHAVKVAFGNEIGRLSKHLGIDGQMLMKLFCQDTQLNISSYYMRPGNPFGGSCLPKDVSALNAFARQEGIALPMLDSVMSTNQAHLDHLLRLITRTGFHQILIVGLTFKKGTDDLRGSPMVAVAESLLGKGFDVEIYDSNIDLTRFTGSNEAEQIRRLPHLASRLTTDFSKAASRNDVIVFSQDLVSPQELLVIKRDAVVVDVNGINALQTLSCRYEGICWN